MSRWLRLRRPRVALTLSGEPVDLSHIAPGTRLDVTVADACTRGWVTVPPPGLRDLGELRAVAEARFEAVFHEPATAWCIEADWSAERAFVCSAVPRSLLEALQAPGITVRSVVPQWVRAFNQVPQRALTREPLALVCAFGPQGVAALFMQEGVPLDWRQHWCAPGEALQCLRSQALVTGCELPTQAWALGELGALPQGMRWHRVVGGVA